MGWVYSLLWGDLFESMVGYVPKDIELDSSKFFKGEVEFSPKGEKPSWVRSAERILPQQSMFVVSVKVGENARVENESIVADIRFENGTMTLSVATK